MNKIVRLTGVVAVSVFLLVAAMTTVPAKAADTKIAVIDIQKVLVESKAGIKAKGKMEKKMEELKASLQKDENVLIALQKEMEKKAAAWSEE